MTFESEAMLHNWMQFVIKGTTIDLKSNTYCQVELARWRDDRTFNVQMF